MAETMSSHLTIAPIADNKFSVFNKISKKTHIIGNKECSILQSLDGRDITKEQILNSGFSSIQFEMLIKRFSEIGFLKSSEVRPPFKVTRIPIGVFNPNSILSENTLFVKVFSSVLFYLTVPMFIIGLLIQGDIGEIFGDAALIMHSYSGLWIIPITLVVTILHEFGHLIVAKRFGVNVPEFGFILYWFLPAMYVNLSCVALLKSKLQRLVIFLAGIFLNVLLIDLALLIRPQVDPAVRTFLSWFILDNLLSILFNLFVFLKYDGYLVLKELVGIPYLREKAFEIVRDFFIGQSRQPMRGKVSFQTDESLLYKPLLLSKDIFLFLYGLISISYIPVLLLSIVVIGIRAFIH